MIVYNGGNITNLIKNIGEQKIFITDTMARAIRYANAQATGEVNPDMDQEMVEDTVVLEIEVNEVDWLRRPEDHPSLDICEAQIKDFKIKKAIIRFCDDDITRYGTYHTGYKSREQVIEILESNGIEIKAA